MIWLEEKNKNQFTFSFLDLLVIRSEEKKLLFSTFGASVLVWYLLSGSLTRLCERCLGTDKDPLDGADLSPTLATKQTKKHLEHETCIRAQQYGKNDWSENMEHTGKLEIPYWTEEIVQQSPVDTSGAEGSALNRFPDGAAVVDVAVWLVTLYTKFGINY